MNGITGFAKGIYYFFVEDGSVAIGALVALLVVAILTHLKAFSNAASVAGPLLFVMISALLVANLLRVAQHARAGK
jgi:hypothetical protein